VDDPGTEWERRMGQKKDVFPDWQRMEGTEGFSGRLIVPRSGEG